MIRAARVLVDGSSSREFDYSIPEALRDRVVVGARVRVSLRKRKSTGTVAELIEHSQSEADRMRLRDLDGLIDDIPALTPQLLDLGRWISKYYCAPMESVMRALLPEAVRTDAHSAKTQKVVVLAKQPKKHEIDELARKAPRQASILRDLLENANDGGAVMLSEIGSSTAPKSPVGGLIEKGWVRIEDLKIERDPHDQDEFVATKPLTLTEEQAAAMEKVLEAVENPAGSKPILIHGVTGSGKTEIYLQAVQRVLDRGMSAIVLVPEISLTPQTVDRVKSRFADIQGQVAVLHSSLSQGERYDEWQKIHQRRARIVVGARSAIFAPLENLGLIVVDEEHEGSYKQDSPPRYHARDIAVVRGKFAPCAVLLGSATPGIESWHNTMVGKYQLVSLKKRVDDQTMPLIRIVDMRRESGFGPNKAPSILSERLRGAIDKRLEDGEQVILFLNRRGFATSLMCPACGHACECKHCSVSLTFHRKHERLMCHICGFQQIAPRKCPECSDPAIRFAGFGTEKVEEILGKVFSSARIARVDADTMARKHKLRDTLNAFKAHKLDMLIGTQMIAKGLHFPSVTLVGILNADMGLYTPDFRAGERTFSLLTQVAGRAGRGELKGEVIVQTATPHSPSIQFARHHDYEGFVDQELEFRKGFGFPPFTHVVLLTCRSTHERRAEFCLETLHKRLLDGLPEGIFMGEPMASPLARAAGQYRFQLMLRAPTTKLITAHLNKVVAATTMPEDVILTIDVDPTYLG